MTLNQRREREFHRIQSEEILESENGKVGYRKKDGWGMDKWIGHGKFWLRSVMILQY